MFSLSLDRSTQATRMNLPLQSGSSWASRFGLIHSLRAIIVAAILSGSPFATPVSAQDESEPTKPAGESVDTVSDEKPTTDQNDAKEPDTPETIEEPDGPETIEVESSPIEVLVKATGVFESLQTTPIVLQPEKWSSLKVERVVAHGSQVMEGDPILQLETKDLDDAIADLERSLKSSKLSLRLATDELRFMKESTAMDLEQVKKSADIATEELNYYTETREARNLLGAEMSLKNAQYRLEYAQEELDQLQQMYEADDLTEQTEEIILKRTARDVEMAKFSLEEAKLRYNRQTETLFAREKDSLVTSQAKAELSKAKSLVTLPLMLQKKELDIAELQKSVADAEEKLADYQADREEMTVLAPDSGLVYYGKPTRGKWTEVATREKQLQPAGSVAKDQVLMTIVDPADLAVVATVSEDEVALLAVGQPAAIRAKIAPNARITGQVQKVLTVPQADGKYLVHFFLPLQQLPASINPGMLGLVTVQAYSNDEAILVPEGSVFTDEFGERTDPYVWLVGDDEAEPVKHYVTVGYQQEKKLEITEGLQAGDVILKSAPEEK